MNCKEWEAEGHEKYVNYTGIILIRAGSQPSQQARTVH